METEKPEITIGILGQDGHGKTSLTSAITKSLVRLSSSVVEGDEIVINIGDCTEDRTRPFVYETTTHRYEHVDCRRHIDVVKNLMLDWIPLDGAVLVVAADAGVTAQTKEQVHMAHVIGLPAMVAFLNKCDLINEVELLEMVEREIRELLSENGYATAPIIRGSALAALNNCEANPPDVWNRQIQALLDAMDTTIPSPPNIDDVPFLMSIEDVFTISRPGTLALGRVEKGTYRINTPVEMVGLGPTRLLSGMALEQFHKSCDVIYAGDFAAMHLDIDRASAHRGQMLATPGTIQAYSQFRAELYLCAQRENGRRRPDLSGPEYLFFLRSIEVNGTLNRAEGNDPLREGEIVRVNVELEVAMAIEPRLHFILRQSGRSIGYGIITDPLF